MHNKNRGVSNIQLQYKTLENGLRIVGEEIEHVKSVSLGIWISTGTRNELDSIQGISHFIEHLLFKGTKNRTSKHISNDIHYYGGSINAFTTHNHTCFHVKMPYNHIEEGLDVLADMVLNSVFEEDEIEKEKSVITEEIKMYEDSSEEYIYEKMLEKTFLNKGIGRNILGTKESVKNINREEVLKYFSTHYLPDNAVVVASGFFKFDELTELISKKLSGWSGKIDKDSIKVEGQEFNKCILIENKDDEQVNLAFYMQCPDDSNAKDYYAVKLLGNILGSTSSSRLFQKVREERGLCYSIYTQDNFYVGFAEFGIYSSVAKENAKDAIELIIDEIIDVKKNFVTEDELEFAKEYYKGSLVMNMEDTADRMMTIGTYEVVNDRIPTFEEIINTIDSIDMDYMKNIISRTFTTDISIAVTGKNIKKIINKDMFERIWR